jgi:hypothetical protein
VLLALHPEFVEAQSQQTVAVITGLRLNNGDVQITAPGKRGVQKAGPFQNLYPGTKVQAIKDASVEIYYNESGETVTVNQTNPLHEVKTKPSQTGLVEKISNIGKLLLEKYLKPPSEEMRPMTGRGGRSLTLLTPRNTKLMTSSPTFKWVGMENDPGTVTVFGPEGNLWSAQTGTFNEIQYPSSAPRLQPGVQYFWSIVKKDITASRVRFEILSAPRVEEVEENLKALNTSTQLTENTLTVLKATYLISQELFHDAREVLIDAQKTNHNEPVLHLLLQEVYEKTRLMNFAEQEHNRAKSLLRIK